MAEINVTKDLFEKEVLKADKPVLVDFWATWCGPCRMLGPIISEIAKEHPEIKVCKVNIDEEEELASIYNVSSIPTLLLFKDGKIIETSIGVRPKNQIVDMILGK